VEYAPKAINALAHIWTASLDRQAVTRASNLIDRLLKFAPDTVGHPFGNQRLLTVHPLAATYEVLPDDCKVIVLEVTRAP